jgi:hypothetical protein
MVDDMAAKSSAHDHVYEWSNDRLASSLLTTRKRDGAERTGQVVESWLDSLLSAPRRAGGLGAAEREKRCWNTCI